MKQHSHTCTCTLILVLPLFPFLFSLPSSLPSSLSPLPPSFLLFPHSPCSLSLSLSLPSSLSPFIPLSSSLTPLPLSFPQGASFASVDALEWAILPASLFFYHAKGPLLLQTLILDVEGYTLQFKLGPAFALYMMARCYLSPDFQPGASTSECKKNLVLTLKNVATNIKRAIKVGEVWRGGIDGGVG